MNGLSYRAREIIIYSILAAGVLGGIALGAIFPSPDTDIHGRPIMVLNIGLMFSVWLVGIIVAALYFGKSGSRKRNRRDQNNKTGLNNSSK